MNRLPAELIDHIIDFLHSDDQTLSVCSLVCRNWLPASRFHLFELVQVQPYSVPFFVELLASPLSTIASYVRILEIYARVFDAIALHFEDFITLKTITIYGTRTEWVPISETNLSREFGRIGTMELTSVCYNIYSFRFLFSFTAGENGPPSFSSTLRVLNSAMCGTKPSRWLPIVVQLPAVSKLDFIGIDEVGLPTVQNVLKSGGQFIHTVKLGFFSRPGLELISDCVDLTRYTNLHSLSISSLSLHTSKEFAGHESFLKIIQRISSPSITHIEISVSIDDHMDLTRLDCEKVADELNHPRFAKLQKVCITVTDFSDKTEDVMAWVRREMSTLADRGILTVTVCSG